MFAACSCNELQVNDKTSTPGFFNLDVFMQEQTDSLKKLNVIVTKITWFNNKTEEVFFRADTGFWKREFDIISSADISQPAISGRYNTLESDSSGFSITAYEAVDPDIDGISFMRVTRNGSGEILNIDISHKENNFLYHNRRNMNLDFWDSHGKLPGLLREYRISGTQKIILRKEVSYEIKTILDFS